MRTAEKFNVQDRSVETAKDICGTHYVATRTLPDDRLIGVHRPLFHWSLDVDIHDWGYQDRYCYQTREGAEAAMRCHLPGALRHRTFKTRSGGPGWCSRGDANAARPDHSRKEADLSLDLEGEVRALFRQKMMEFLEWSQGNWTIADKDGERDEWVREKSPDYRAGYNAGIDGMKGAFECWNEEFGP